MATEIERKFLVRSEGWRAAAREDAIRLVQGYLHVGDDDEVRVRLRDDAAATLTVKRGGRSRERVEVEVALDADAARRLLDRAVVGRTVRKRRHLVDLPAAPDGRRLVAEVDVFEGDHAGLVVAEIELPDAETPVPELDWLGEEVTGDPRFYNAVLAAPSPSGDGDAP